ncbi:MSCRAMM family protein, partial [Microbacterium sp. HJ5]
EEPAAPAEEPAAPAEEPAAEEPAAPAEEEPAAPVEESAPGKTASRQAAQAEEEVSLLAAPCIVQGGFEIDGNYAAGDCAGADWSNVNFSSTTQGGTYNTSNKDDDEDTTEWDSSGNTPPKGDFQRVYSYSTTVGSEYFLQFGWERGQEAGTGGYLIEVTNAGARTASDGTPQPIRDNGGAVFVITTQGGAAPVLRFVCLYTDAEDYPGTCTAYDGSGGFVSAVSDTNLTNPFGENLLAGAFFEIGLNVTELTDGVVTPGCPAATDATAYVRSFTGNIASDSKNLKGYVAPLTVDPPSTCGSLTIKKTNTQGAGLAGATFTVSPNPTTGTGSTSVVTGADGTFVFSNNVKPGTYTVTETIAPPGYLLPAQTSQQIQISANGSGTVTFVDPLGGVSWVKHDRSSTLLGGATFQITATGGAAAAAPWDLDSAPITVVDNTGQPGYSGRDTDATPGEFTVAGLPTGTYSVVETVAPAGYVLDPSSKSFTVSQQTPNPTISTAFVNTPYTKVTLTKVWVNSFAGDTAQLSIGGAATANGTSTAPTTGPSIEVSVAPGSSLTLAEALGGSNKGVYSSTLSCVGATVSNNTGTAGSITAPTWPASANGVQCTFTNTAVTKTVTLQKYWVDAIQGDKANLTAGTATATSTATGAATQLDTTNTAVAEVRVGDTITLGETLEGEGVYGSSWSCTTGTSGTGLSFQLTVPNGAVVCTIENEAQRATVELKKQWVNAFAGDAADLDITGAESDSATSVATEGNSTDNVNKASVTVRVGDEVTLSEELGDENTGSYTSTWACDDGTSGQGGSIPEFEVTESVVCTITNTAKTTDIVVNKVWVDAFQGDDAVLSIEDETGTSTANGSANQTDDAVVELTVRVGETITVAEVLGGDNRGQYTSTYACTGAGGEGTGRSTTFTAPDADVECTFTNTANKVGVLLQKRWLGGIALDQARLSIIREGAAELFNVSIADGTFDRLDNIKTVFAQVRIGEILTLAETVSGQGQYESKYVCSAGLLSGTGEGRTFNLTVTQTAICVFANRALTQSVSVVKTWVNGQEGDTADLSIAGGATGSGQSTADGSVGEFTDVVSTVTADALIGEEIMVSELIGVQEGDESDYTSSLVCVGADDTVYFDDSGREGSFTMPNQPVDCEFVNEAELPTIALEKTVVGADVSDTNWQLWATPDEGDPVTDADGGDVAPTEVPTGVDFDLSEELVGDFAGSDEFEAGEWSCMSDISGEIELSDSEPGTATLGGLDKGENVVCMIVNSHVDQGYEFDKSLVSSEQNPDGTWTVTYEITVHNNSELVSREYDLTDTIDATDGVVLSASWTGPTEGDFPEGELEAELADDQTLAPSNGANDDVYTVTVLAEITSIPGEAEPCEGEESGIGIVNTAVLTVEDDEPIDDDACGTIHLDDVGLEKTSSSTSVEPGVPFDYVLTVTNHGTRDAIAAHVRDDDLHPRLDIVDLTLSDGFGMLSEPGWTENGGGQANDIVDLVLDAPLAPGESMTVTISVVLSAQPAVSVLDPGDPVPTPPAPLESLVNNACVDTEIDTVGGPFDGEPFAPNCDDLTIEVREMTGVVYTACVSDTAVLRYIIRTSPALSQLPVSGSWVTDEEPNAAGHSLTIGEFFANPQGVSGEIQWPGSMFVGNPPVAIDYPGWRLLEAADYGPDGGYINPADGLEYAPEDAGFFVFNGLILDPSELDFAWRGQSTVTFEVNPTLTFDVEYPSETTACFQARHTEVQIEKTASVDVTEVGGTFSYDLAVENVSADSAAEGVIVTDEIPADLMITDITWPGQDDDSVFPNWESCDVTGQDSAGFGGTLECVLFGPLQPQGVDEGATSAPTITLTAMVSQATTATEITNVAVVDYHTFGDPGDPGRDSDDATVTVPRGVLPEPPPLPATGGDVPWGLALFGVLALLAGVTALTVVRRRRGGETPTL